MDKVSDLIPRVLSRRGLKDQANASYVTYAATEWITQNMPMFSDAIHVLSLKDSVLKIACDHPIASQELVQQVEALRSHLGSLGGVAPPEVVISRSM